MQIAMKVLREERDQGYTAEMYVVPHSYFQRLLHCGFDRPLGNKGG
jgi:hypothetical protein